MLVCDRPQILHDLDYFVINLLLVLYTGSLELEYAAGWWDNLSPSALLTRQ